MSDTHLSDTRCSEFALPEPIQQGLDDLGFTHCTPIQAAVLPLALAGHDVAGQAQTGTGKTAAFLISAFARLLTRPEPEQRRDNQPRALVIAPTRELALQIHRDAEALGRHAGLRLGLVYGGVDYDKQRRQLAQRIDLLIGTPGRLIDYNKQGALDLRGIEVAVLDEADRMFDLGFIRDIRFLFRRMPKPERRQSMLFSATLSYRVLELAYEHMNNPELVKIEAERVTADKVEQTLYYPSNSEKIPLLIGLLRRERPKRAIVFTNTKRNAEEVLAWLRGNDIRAEILSGDVPQKKRQRLLGQFEQGEFDVLIATDVAARGLHIPDVTHVFNYDLPQDAEDYVHRIGRTARAGASGQAFSFACEDTAFYLPDIEVYIGQKIPHEGVSPELLVEPKPRARIEHHRGPRPGGRSGRSGGKGGDRGRGRAQEGRRRRRGNGSRRRGAASGKQAGG